MGVKVKFSGILSKPDKFVSKINEGKVRFLHTLGKTAVQNIKDEIEKLDVVDAGLKKKAKDAVHYKVDNKKGSVELFYQQHVPFSEGEIKDIENSLTHKELKANLGNPKKIGEFKGKLFQWAPKDSYAYMDANKYYLSHYMGSFVDKAMRKTELYIKNNIGKIMEGI